VVKLTVLDFYENFVLKLAVAILSACWGQGMPCGECG
jgi:hypothetical protein